VKKTTVSSDASAGTREGTVEEKQEPADSKNNFFLHFK
jgi:hypothetical protein